MPHHPWAWLTFGYDDPISDLGLVDEGLEDIVPAPVRVWWWGWDGGMPSVGQNC